jgi:hypothetical protein
LQYEVALGIADAAAAAVAALGYTLLRNVRPMNISGLPQAFQALERSIEVNAGRIPEGYTWGEAFERLKEEGVRVDWVKMKDALQSYEAYKYGGKEETSAGKDEVIKLAMKIRRGVIGKRTKG